MNKEHILYGIIGILVGIIIGYVGTNSINRANAPSPQIQTAAQTSNDLPPDHPPTGATGATGATETAGAAGKSGDNAGSGPQAEVMAVIQKARKEPSNYEAQLQAASLYSQINRHEQALEFYDRAAKIKPDDIDLLTKLGNANFDLQRYEDAERWYQKALKINPNNTTVRMDLGLSYYLRQPRDLDKAIAEYRKALGYNPRHEKTLQNLTIALLDKGDKTAARESFKVLEGINPSNQTLAQIRDRLK